MHKVKFCEEARQCIQQIALQCGDERAAKAGYDLFGGLITRNALARLKAWQAYLVADKEGGALAEEERDGVWVPAISL